MAWAALSYGLLLLTVWMEVRYHREDFAKNRNTTRKRLQNADLKECIGFEYLKILESNNINALRIWVSSADSSPLLKVVSQSPIPSVNHLHLFLIPPPNKRSSMTLLLNHS
jgi:hypothetical protein